MALGHREMNKMTDTYTGELVSIGEQSQASVAREKEPMLGFSAHTVELAPEEGLALCTGPSIGALA